MTGRLLGAGALAALGAAAGCSGGSASGPEILVVVSAPVSTSPWVGNFVTRGARLAVEELNEEGGVDFGDGRHRLRLEVLDNAGSPRRAVANARAATSDRAAVLVTDGTGAVAVAGVTEAAHLPVFVTFDGGGSVVAPDRRSVFRMAPANRPMSTRLADYLAEKKPHVGLIADDSSYGRDGAAAMRAALLRDRVPIVADVTVPAAASDLSTQVLAARRAGADYLVLWCSASDVAEAVQAARSSGWQVPIYAGPTGEDPLVRQRLAANRDWVDGLTFVSFRITSEIGPAPFERYRTAYEKRFGPDLVGVEQDGRDVVQPPDWSTYGYDAVKLTAAALTKSKAVGAPLLNALENTTITGANGDERGYGPGQREGVSPDDMYFGRFDGFVFAAVKDDILSTNLPTVPQLR